MGRGVWTRGRFGGSGPVAGPGDVDTWRGVIGTVAGRGGESSPGGSGVVDP